MIGFLRFIFIVCIFFVLQRVFRWLSGNTPRPQGRPQGGTQRQSSAGEKNLGTMVKDPVCGTYVDPSLAVSLVRGGKDIFFCSKECLSRYKGKTAGGVSG